MGIILLVLLLALLFALHVAGTMRLLDRSSREGRRISAELRTTHPLTNFTRNGTTQFEYQWDQYGRITAIADNKGGAVSGCVPH